MKKSGFIFCAVAFVFGLAVLAFLIPSGQILPEVNNAYYLGEQAGGLVIALQPYGACLALGVFCAAVLMLLAVIRKKCALAPAVQFLPCALWMGIFLSRLLYCLVNVLFYAQTSFLSCLKIWEGGMAMTGALLGGVLAARFTIKDKTLSDLLAPALAVFVLIARLAERLSQTGYGMDVEFSGMFAIADEYGARLNVSLIEALTAALLLLLVVLYLHSRVHQAGDGLPVFLILYGASQILMESLRADRHMIWGFVKAEQVFSLLLALAALLPAAKRAKKIPLAVLSALFVAILAFALEKALDRLSIPYGVLYGAFALVLCAYCFVAFRIIRRANHNFEEAI